MPSHTLQLTNNSIYRFDRFYGQIAGEEPLNRRQAVNSTQGCTFIIVQEPHDENMRRLTPLGDIELGSTSIASISVVAKVLRLLPPVLVPWCLGLVGFSEGMQSQPTDVEKTKQTHTHTPYMTGIVERICVGP